MPRTKGPDDQQRTLSFASAKAKPKAKGSPTQGAPPKAKGRPKGVAENKPRAKRQKPEPQPADETKAQTQPKPQAKKKPRAKPKPFMLPPSPLDESDDPAAAVDHSAHVDDEQLQWKRIVPVAPDGSSIIAPTLSEQLQQSQMVPVEPDGSSIIGPTLSGSSIIGPKPVDPDAGPVSCTRDVMR